MFEKPLSRDELERLIAEFFQSQQMCVLATCADNMPRASAVEFFPEGTTLYILTEGGRKVENIKKNPSVSVAIHTQFTGWDSIAGAQVTGIAETGKFGSAIFKEGVAAYKKRKGLKVAAIPPFMNVVKVTPKRIEYLDTTLKAKGHGVRHVLEY